MPTQPMQGVGCDRIFESTSISITAMSNKCQHHTRVTAMLSRSGRALRATAVSVTPTCRTGRSSPMLVYNHLSTTSACTAILSTTAAARPAKTTYTKTSLIVLRRQSSHQLY